MYISYNANPAGNNAIDCTVRAISTALGLSWDEVYDGICYWGSVLKNMPSADAVWGQYLRSKGFRRHIVPCRDNPCTVREFCEMHPRGVYILCVYQHVICIADGCYIDTFDSGDEYAIYYWSRPRRDDL